MYVGTAFRQVIFPLFLFGFFALAVHSAECSSVVRNTSGIDSNAASVNAPISVASWVPFAELASSDNSSQFGQSVSVSGNVAVVGSPGDMDRTGAAYVFAKSSGADTKVSPTARLTASDGEPNDEFGNSVSISGNTIVVGAFGSDGHGKAYIFVEPPRGWTDMTESAQLTASDAQPNDEFGSSVSISQNTVSVGALGHNNNNNSDEGAIYVFVEPGTGWVTMTQTAELTASDGIEGSELGFSVAIANGTIVGGAPCLPCSAGAVGAVYVFAMPVNGWVNMTETAKLTDPQDLGIGLSVGVSGNMIVTGSPTGSVGKGPTGAADLYIENGGWKTTTRPNARLSASDGHVGDQFGFSVTTTGNTILAGAPYAPCLGNNCQQGIGPGIVYAFAKPATGWTSMTESQQLTPSDGMTMGLFGESVAASGPAVLVGAIGTDTAYAYRYTTNSGFIALSVFGSEETTALGINTQGEIVGSYTNASNCPNSTCGFLDAAGTISTIAYPGATSTSAVGINDSDEIVGFYYDTSNVGHGFTELNGSYSSIDFPGGIETFIEGLNNLGEIVGWYYDSAGNLHGFMDNNGVFISIDAPGATATFASGINDSQVIVGSACAGNCTRETGFRYTNGTFSAVKYPGAVSTTVNGINNVGDLTGIWSGKSPGQGGAFVFFEQKRKFTDFNLGGPDDTSANGINNSEEIVGTFCQYNTLPCYGFFGYLPGH